MNKFVVIIFLIAGFNYILSRPIQHDFPYSNSKFYGDNKNNVNGINIDKLSSVRIEADTVASNNRISNLYANQQDYYTVKIDLESFDNDIELIVYNILGKKVKDIYKGPAKSKDQDYNFTTNDLPDGVYICVLLGKDFRTSRKFIISR